MEKDTLKHQRRIKRIKEQEGLKKATKEHNKEVKKELDKAKNGKTINLTSLMAGKEELCD